MDEKAILQLIARAVRQILRLNHAGWQFEDEIRISEEIADSAWNALILGARESLIRGKPFVLDEFGIFEFDFKGWQFHAAESLQDAIPKERYANSDSDLYFATQALYFAQRAMEFAYRVPADTEIAGKPDGNHANAVDFYAYLERKTFAQAIEDISDALMVANKEKSMALSSLILESIDEPEDTSRRNDHYSSSDW